MSPQRSSHFKAKVKEIWGLGNVSFFPNFPGTPLGKQIRKLTMTPKKPCASVSLSYRGFHPTTYWGVAGDISFSWHQPGWC